MTSLVTVSDLKIKPVKGQLLKVEWPDAQLPFPMNSQAYVVGNPSEQSCIVGATFEKDFLDEKPDVDLALELLKPKIAALYPGLEAHKILGCRAGLRGTTPDRLPIAKQIGERQWVLAGLGSKGLLYHALYAEELANTIQSCLI